MIFIGNVDGVRKYQIWLRLIGSYYIVAKTLIDCGKVQLPVDGQSQSDSNSPNWLKPRSP
ncbi:hypothetical protein FRX31_026303 [Thalictrum thalictroides]|uniref:Uncharacterized protein n=1 Tax=Thalictrum thalictroides TaxID=46969 RepID=A0A7J6VIU9_THATH|nr:hypothetical protein FRX31_026303 [Thalictrum thalictroides]